LFNVSNVGNLTLNKLTIGAGNLTPAVVAIVNAGTLTSTNGHFSGESGVISNTGTLTITNVSFSGTNLTGNGGAIINTTTDPATQLGTSSVLAEDPPA
jgi:hypothetical protein